jgi:2-polyprenyl-6-methoxyphenol hydroxylase-like FAD-dependent oxidoreductase
VGGLTLAVALSRYPDITVDVYEAAQSFREIGAGVGIWPRAFKVENFKTITSTRARHDHPFLGPTKVRG